MPSLNTEEEPLQCQQFLPQQLQLSSALPLGSGALAQVVRSRLCFGNSNHDVSRRVPVAIKIVSKLQALHQHKVEAVMMEKEALLRLAPCPFTARLFGTAQSEDELFFVLECLPHGDLLQHIRRCAVKAAQRYHRSHQSPPAPPQSISSAAAAVSGFLSPSETNVFCSSPCSPSGGTAAPSPTAAATAATASAATAKQPPTGPPIATGPPGGLRGARGEVVPPIPLTALAQRCMTFKDTQLVAAQLVLGIARAYEKGIVLRDFKPENIAFDDHYRACLLDFDTADVKGSEVVPAPRPRVGEEERAATAGGERRDLPKRSSSGDPSRPRDEDSEAERFAPPPAACSSKRRRTVSEIQTMRKNTASFCGTAQYVSPEMLGSCQWSVSSDLWALGATVYEMIYGTRMFEGAFTFEVLQKVMNSGKVSASFPPVHLSSYSSSSAGGVDAPTIAPLSSSHLSRSSSCMEAPSSVEAEAEVEGPTASPFCRTKAFIQALVQVDPRQRLGVNPLTSRFDLQRIRDHCFFADFDWAVLDRQTRSYRPHHWQQGRTAAWQPGCQSPLSASLLHQPVGGGGGGGLAGAVSANSSVGALASPWWQDMSMSDVINATPHSASSTSYTPQQQISSSTRHKTVSKEGSTCRSEDEDEKTKEAMAEASWAADVLGSMFDDGTESLGPLYEVCPFNDPRYSHYVYQATADANPFERFLFGGKGADGLHGEVAGAAGSGHGDAAGTSAVATGLAPLGMPPYSSSGEEDDVIDDVGMHFHGSIPDLS